MGKEFLISCLEVLMLATALGLLTVIFFGLMVSLFYFFIGKKAPKNRGKDTQGDTLR